MVARVQVIVWFGLLAGLAEAALLAVARFALGRYTHLPADLFWMSPVASTVVFSLVGLLLFGLGLLYRPLRSLRTAILTLSFLAAFNALLLISQLHHAAAFILAAGLAIQATAIATRHQDRFQKVVRLTVAPLAALVIIAGATFELMRRNQERHLAASLPVATRGVPNVLFIIWDTVRSTNLSLFGYHRRTTPFLEELAKRGVVFERAASPASWTLPSHAGLFTGAFPHEVDADWAARLEAGKLTLAEFFAGLGYRTGGFAGNTYYCSRESGLSRGFGRYEDFVRSDFAQIMMGSALLRQVYANYPLRHILRLHEEPGRKSADDMNNSVLSWLDESGERPFFAFVNYFDAHAPYLPPSPYDTMFGARVRGRNPLISEERPMSQAELRTEIDAYDGAIRHLDQALRELLGALDERGLLRNTIVVVTSDHGEQFGEHGLVNHGNSLYMPLLHVPLLIVAPARVSGGKRITDWISTTELPATIAAMAGQNNPFPGHSLSRYWDTNATVAGGQSNRVLSEVSEASGLPKQYPANHGDMISVIYDDYQLIRNTGANDELFHLATDPAQLRNLGSLENYRAVKEKLRRLSSDTASRFTTSRARPGD